MFLDFQARCSSAREVTVGKIPEGFRRQFYSRVGNSCGNSMKRSLNLNPEYATHDNFHVLDFDSLSHS